MSENKLTLADFPPKLRKVALVIAESEKRGTLKEACRITDVNYNSAKVLIDRHRKKGKNFWDLVNQKHFEYLQNNVYRVDQTTLEKAITGTHKDRELFYKRTGILKETPLVHIDNRSLTVIASPNFIPASVSKSLPEADANEIEIEGPKTNQP